MNIKEFSKRSGIPAYTLRYYEKIGIFREVNRNASGHRDFTEQDLAWAEFINRLKETAMPLEQIRRYADLREQGIQTARDRMALLADHAAALSRRIAEENVHLLKIQDKMKYYEGVLADRFPLDLE